MNKFNNPSAFYPGPTRYGGSSALALRRQAARKTFFGVTSQPTSVPSTSVNLIHSYTINKDDIVRKEPSTPQLTSSAKRIFKWIEANSKNYNDELQITKRRRTKHRFNPMPYNSHMRRSQQILAPAPTQAPKPGLAPAPVPSLAPTPAPSLAPTPAPSLAPAPAPSLAPAQSLAPAPAPTQAPKPGLAPALAPPTPVPAPALAPPSAPAPGPEPTPAPAEPAQSIAIVPKQKAILDQTNDGSNMAPIIPKETPQFIKIPKPMQQPQIFDMPAQQSFFARPIMEPTFQPRPPKPIVAAQQAARPTITATSETKTSSQAAGSRVASQEAAKQQQQQQPKVLNNLLSPSRQVEASESTKSANNNNQQQLQQQIAPQQQFKQQATIKETNQAQQASVESRAAGAGDLKTQQKEETKQLPEPIQQNNNSDKNHQDENIIKPPEQSRFAPAIHKGTPTGLVLPCLSRKTFKQAINLKPEVKTTKQTTYSDVEMDIEMDGVSAPPLPVCTPIPITSPILPQPTIPSTTLFQSLPTATTMVPPSLPPTMIPQLVIPQPVTGSPLPNGTNPFLPTSTAPRGRKVLRPTRRLHR